MPKFRKKPVVIEAEQFHEWQDGRALPFAASGVVQLGESGFFVETLEGPLHVSHGDWIIRGVKGEFYPCKPDIFAASYESAE